MDKEINEELNSHNRATARATLSPEAVRDFDEHYVRYMNDGSENWDVDNPF